jgi:hypothetical protein
VDLSVPPPQRGVLLLFWYHQVSIWYLWWQIFGFIGTTSTERGTQCRPAVNLAHHRSSGIFSTGPPRIRRRFSEVSGSPCSFSTGFMGPLDRVRLAVVLCASSSESRRKIRRTMRARLLDEEVVKVAHMSHHEVPIFYFVLRRDLRAPSRSRLPNLIKIRSECW